MIVAENLSKSFGKVLAVDSVNFRIPRGRVVGFLGPNGAGKTTTIRMIAGYLPPTAGTIRIDSLEVRANRAEVRRMIGYLPESTPLYTEMRVAEYLRFRAKLFGIERAGRRKAIETALSRCWLRDVRRRPIRHLSKGYRQRVGLAAALLHEPPVLILDEPTVGLDPSQIREVRGLIRELAGHHTILLSTHILPEAELICDEIIMIALGRIAAQGAVDELRAKGAGRGCCIVETDSGDARGAIAGIKSVSNVEMTRLDDGWYRMKVNSASADPELSRAIGRILAEQGFAIRELKREEPSLEQMFMQIAGSPPPDNGTPESEPLGSVRSRSSSARTGGRQKERSQ